MRRFFLVIVVLCLVLGTDPLAADVTVRSRVEASGLASGASGDSVVYIKGDQMRSESGSGKSLSAYILDADARQMIVLNPKKKRAEIHDLTDLAQQMQQVSADDISISFEPGSGTKEIAGYTCQRFDLEISIAIPMAEQLDIETKMSGPVWIANDVPGQDEYVGFWINAAEKGLFFMAPEAASAQPGRAKGFAEMRRTMAEQGVSLGSAIEIGFGGSGPMAAAMSAMSFTMETTVTSISTDPIPDSIFEIPAGYKVINH